MITIRDLVDFVLKNRRGKAFVGWTEDNIATAIYQGVITNSVFYAVDEHKNLVGIALGIKYADIKVMFVSAILSTKKGVLKQFINLFNTLYPHWKIAAQRHDRHVEYEASKLLNRKD